MGHRQIKEPECFVLRSNHMSTNRASQAFTQLANAASQAAGRAITFVLAFATIIVWAITGPLFGFSDTWQLVINTGTTIVTFLMVFLIQNSQNRDSAAIQVKLDEIIRTSPVHNSFVGIEHLTEEEIEELRAKCEQRAKQSPDEGDPQDDATLQEVREKATLAAEAVSA